MLKNIIFFSSMLTIFNCNALDKSSRFFALFSSTDRDATVQQTVDETGIRYPFSKDKAPLTLTACQHKHAQLKEYAERLRTGEHLTPEMERIITGDQAAVLKQFEKLKKEQKKPNLRIDEKTFGKSVLLLETKASSKKSKGVYERLEDGFDHQLDNIGNAAESMTPGFPKCSLFSCFPKF